jgi:hypothetical protein
VTLLWSDQRGTYRPWDQFPQDLEKEWENGALGILRSSPSLQNSSFNLGLASRFDLMTQCYALGFDWSLHFQWEQLSLEQKALRLDPTEPIR